MNIEGHVLYYGGKINELPKEIFDFPYIESSWIKTFLESKVEDTGNKKE